MLMVRHPHILFIQGGGGSNAHDEWDAKLVESLKRKLGDNYEVRYPRMPDEGDPSFTKWKPAIEREIAELGDQAVLIGHSIGGTMLINALAQREPERDLAAIMLVSAPFVGDGGWPTDEFETPADLGAKLPRGVPVHIFQGTKDDTTPAAHAQLYAEAIPQAQLHMLHGRDHQLNNDLSEVSDVIRELTQAQQGAH